MKFWWNWRKRDKELEKEIQQHLRMAEADRTERGASIREAQSGARREFGNLALAKELTRDVWGWRWLRDALEDARYGFRMLSKNRGATAAVIIALALGIGVNTTVFSFVNALLLRPPALVKAPERLLEVWLHNPRSSGAEGYLPLTYPDYVYHRDHNQSFEGMLAFDGDPHLVIWNRSGEGQVVLGQLVSGNFFSLIGVNAVLGRTISAQDDRPTNPQPVVVLGHGFWRQNFRSDPAIIGKTLVLNGTSYSVIGVAPAGFAGLLVGFEPDFWAPLTMVAQVTRDTGRLSNWQGHWLFAAGRLKPDASLSGARAEASVLEHQIETGHPELKRNLDATVFPATLIPGPYRIYVSGFSALLMTVFGLVLLIACANVASFLLARATVRAREMAVRSALGAGRGRLIRQMLVESTLLSLLAGLAGLILAYWAAPLLVALKPASLPITLRLPIDWRVLAFTLMVSLICGVAFGLAPAFRSTKVQVASNLKDERQAAGYRKSRLRSFLIAGQIATCTILLVGATLCVRSLRNASSIDPGFNTQHVIAATLDPGSLGYSEAQVRSFYDQLSEHVRALPGVTAASFTDHLPLGTNREQGSLTDVAHSEVSKSDALSADILRVAPDYFQTMGISLLRGRDFTSPENVQSSGVAIINEALSKRFWKNQDPIGRRMNFFGAKSSMEVIGVVPTGKYRTLGEDPTPVVYLPQLRARRTLVARTSGDPAIALESIRHEIYAVDPKIAATDLETMQQYMSLPLFPARTTGLLLGVSGGMALALTVIGLFGVISYIVFQRTHEIGVRMALGAQRRDILSLVVRHGLVLTVIGLVIGLGIAFAATRFLSSLLYGIAPTDPTTFIGVALLLCLVTALACYLPARRAMRVDPVVALRYE
ncbi:MAG TPA: ABC transporter permease [Candidatus Acidoferrum sp.]|nr:ABC transporter permease [Candidatus Acidoferrum sp.]